MMRWTNDLYLSTPHRVINASGRERYSIAYFFDPNYDAPIETIPTCIPAGETARYEPTTGGGSMTEPHSLQVRRSSFP